MIINPNPNTFGIEGAKEKKEESVTQLVKMRLDGKIPEDAFRKLLPIVTGETECKD